MTQDNRILKEAQGSIEDNWQDCPTMKSVVEAMERGDVLQVLYDDDWETWEGTAWMNYLHYRCRPAKKTKTVVMREVELISPHGKKVTVWLGDGCVFRYTGNERTEEIPE